MTLRIGENYGAAPISEEERENMKTQRITKPEILVTNIWLEVLGYCDLRRGHSDHLSECKGLELQSVPYVKCYYKQSHISIYSRVVEIGGIKDKDFYDSEQI